MVEPGKMQGTVNIKVSMVLQMHYWILMDKDVSMAL